MAQALHSTTPALLAGLRRRGQFVMAALCWLALGGFLVALAGWLAVFFHYGVSLAERLRVSLGFVPPAVGTPDWYLLTILALPLLLGVAAVLTVWAWYGRVWSRRLAGVWGGGAPGASRHARWTGDRARQVEYLDALAATPSWSALLGSHAAPEARAEAALADVERDIVERAFATGLVVGVGTHRAPDLIAIFAAALELQLHVLTRLGKRPSLAAWRLLIERCGASLFVNQYLSRQDALLINLALKKTALGLHAAGDAADAAMQQITSTDLDLDDLLHLNRLDGVPLSGLATKGLEIAATMTLTVGKQGLHALGHLVESAGDDLAQGSIAAAILYHHGMALAGDALAVDAAHRAQQAMNRGFAQGLERMVSLAGSILLDAVRQRRAAFREVRTAAVRQLPKVATGGIKDKVAGWFGRGKESEADAAAQAKYPTAAPLRWRAGTARQTR